MRTRFFFRKKCVPCQKRLKTTDLHGRFQSAYKPHHSCETAMVHIVDDIQQILKSKMNVCLVMLDLSSAFDTVDHELLLDRLERQFLFVKGHSSW